jgi:hypothetical protein
MYKLKNKTACKNYVRKKIFEMSIVEFFDYKIVLMCIYRSPDGDFHIFLKNLEIVIQKCN